MFAGIPSSKMFQWNSLPHLFIYASVQFFCFVFLGGRDGGGGGVVDLESLTIVSGRLLVRPVDRAGSVSEISPRHSFLYKHFDVFI